MLLPIILITIAFFVILIVKSAGSEERRLEKYLNHYEDENRN